MLTTEQKEARKKGLGGSDIAAILGLSPWKSAYDLWLEKTGREQSTYCDDSPVIAAGNRLEPLILKWYREKTGLDVDAGGETLTHPQYPFLLAHLDGKVKRQPKIVEIKFALEFSRNKWGEPGTDEIPWHYLCQVQHYLAVTGCIEADVAVLFGGWDFQIYNVQRDEKLIAAMIKKSARFWRENVLENVAPAPESLEDIKKMFPQDNGEYIPVTPEIEQKLNELKAIKKRLSVIQKEKISFEQDIKEFIGENQGAINCSGETVATWKSSKRMRFDEKEFKEVHPEIWQKYAKPLSTRIFRA